MKFPRNAEDVEREILTSVDIYGQHQELRIKQLAHILQKADVEAVVEGIIRVLESGSDADNYARQEFAGRILEIVRPKSRKDAKELLQRVLKNWNKSVKQFPFWLRENYGIDKLNEIFSKLELTALEEDKLQTIKWWLHLNEANT